MQLVQVVTIMYLLCLCEGWTTPLQRRTTPIQRAIDAEDSSPSSSSSSLFKNTFNRLATYVKSQFDELKEQPTKETKVSRLDKVQIFFLGSKGSKQKTEKIQKTQLQQRQQQQQQQQQLHEQMNAEAENAGNFDDYEVSIKTIDEPRDSDEGDNENKDEGEDDDGKDHHKPKLVVEPLNKRKENQHLFDGDDNVDKVLPKQLTPKKAIFVLAKDGYFNVSQMRATINFEINHTIKPESIQNVKLNIRVFKTTKLTQIYFTDANKTFQKQLPRNIFDLGTFPETTKWLTFDFRDEIIEQLKSNPGSAFLCVEMTSPNEEISSVQRKDSYLTLNIKKSKKRTRRERKPASACRVHMEKVSLEDIGMNVIFPYRLKRKKKIPVHFCAGSCLADSSFRGRRKERCCVASKMGEGTIVLISKKNQPSWHTQKVYLHTRALECECR